MASIVVAERKVEVLELHKKGASIGVISAALDIPESLVREYLNKALQELSEKQETLITSIRDVELERLDALQLSIWDAAIAGKPAYIDRVLKIMERRARLLGLDKPTQVEHDMGDSFLELVQKANEPKKAE